MSRAPLATILLTLALRIICANCAPTAIAYDHRYRAPIVYQTDGKMLWSLLPDLIASIDWLPIEINVPDVVANFGDSLSHVVQSIPIVNRFPNHNRPRPFRLHFVTDRVHAPSKSVHDHPFDDDGDQLELAAYP